MGLFDEYVAGVRRATDEQKLLLELHATSGDATRLLRALISATAVIGDDLVERALVLMAARPPAAYRAAAFKIPESVHFGQRCDGCGKPTRERALYERYDGKTLCSSCYYHTPDAADFKSLRHCDRCGQEYSANMRWRGTSLYCQDCYAMSQVDLDAIYHKAQQQRAMELAREEKVQGTPVAANKLLYGSFGAGGAPQRIFMDDGSSWQEVDPTTRRYEEQGEPALVDVIRGALERCGLPIKPDACEFCGSTDRLDKQDMGEGRVMTLCSLCRGTVQLGIWKEAHAPLPLDEPEVTEAVTDKIAYLMEKGKVDEAQALILDGLDRLGTPAAYTAPQYVMPAPRPSRVPDLCNMDNARLSDAPTGKPCRVCMKPAYHVVERDGKSRHYCAEHFDASGKA